MRHAEQAAWHARFGGLEEPPEQPKTLRQALRLYSSTLFQGVTQVKERTVERWVSLRTACASVDSIRSLGHEPVKLLFEWRLDDETCMESKPCRKVDKLFSNPGGKRCVEVVTSTENFGGIMDCPGETTRDAPRRFCDFTMVRCHSSHSCVNRRREPP